MTAGMTHFSTPNVLAFWRTISRSASNSAASRWQWVSIQGMALVLQAARYQMQLSVTTARELGVVRDNDKGCAL